MNSLRKIPQIFLHRKKVKINNSNWNSLTRVVKKSMFNCLKKSPRKLNKILTSHRQTRNKEPREVRVNTRSRENLHSFVTLWDHNFFFRDFCLFFFFNREKFVEITGHFHHWVTGFALSGQTVFELGEQASFAGLSSVDSSMTSAIINSISIRR